MSSHQTLKVHKALGDFNLVTTEIHWGYKVTECLRYTVESDQQMRCKPKGNIKLFSKVSEGTGDCSYEGLELMLLNCR